MIRPMPLKNAVGKRGLMPDPDQRIFINPEVCEGCGIAGCSPIVWRYCRWKQNWVVNERLTNLPAIRIFLCEGLLSQLVTVSGGALRKPESAAAVDEKRLCRNQLLLLISLYPVLTGVGRPGGDDCRVVAGIAARRIRQRRGIIDMAGLAQKGGAVSSHIRLAPRPKISRPSESARRGRCVTGL